jgi:hypothetical protein
MIEFLILFLLIFFYSEPFKRKIGIMFNMGISIGQSMHENTHKKSNNSKGLFGSHHLELESKNLFIILTITCLAASELIIEFIWNFIFFISYLILIPTGYPSFV